LRESRSASLIDDADRFRSLMESTETLITPALPTAAHRSSFGWQVVKQQMRTLQSPCPAGTFDQ
jgi:hypothetical protein